MVWMFCSRKSKVRFGNIHKRTLRVAYREYQNNYKDLLAGHDEVSIHQKHLKGLATEVVKSANKLYPQLMWCFLKNHETLFSLRCGIALK